MLDPTSAVRLLVLSALVLAHVLLSLRAALGSGPRPSAAAFWQKLARWGHAARTWKQRLVTNHSETGAADADGTARAIATLVADAVRQRKEDARRAGCRNFLHIASVIVVFVVIDYNLRRGEQQVSWLFFFTSLACYLILFLNQHCPGNRSWQTSRLLIATAYFTSHLQQIFSPQSLGVLITIRFIGVMPARSIGSIMVLDTPYVCVLNALSSIGFSITMMVAEYPDDLPGLRWNLCLADILATLFICACARVFEDNVIASCRHAIELKASKSEAYATATVLNATCDAVVQLDEHLRVATADAKLAALLLHGRGCTQAGSDFLQYLHDDKDDQRFREWLKASPNRCDEHAAFETRLRDSTGSAIAVEMFNVPFETITGTTRNFIGIREKALADSAPPHGDQGGMDDDGVAALREFAGPPQRPRRTRRRPQASSESSSSSGSPPSSFQFDALTMEILGYSPGFSAFGHFDPPPRGNNLLDEIPDCDVNMEFLRSFDLWSAALVERSQASLDPVEVEFDSAMVFQLGPDDVWFRMTVNVKLKSTRRPNADLGGQQQLPCAVGTAIVLSVIRDQDCPVSSATSSGPELLSL